MASVILEKLRNIEKGRKLAIKNAKLANLPAADDMDLINIAQLFLQQNNTEDIDPNDPDVVGYDGITGGWNRPTDWIDIDTVLANATQRDNLYPAYILLLDDRDVTTDFAEVTTYKNLRGDGYLTSDGSWYLASNGNCVHTWDTSQDVPCSLGYKTRWVLVYTASTTINQQIILKNDMPCLEALFGAITLGQSALTFGGVVNSTSPTDSTYFTKPNSAIESIRYTEQTKQDRIYNVSFAAGCARLKNLSLPNVLYIYSNGGSNYFCCQCTSLTNIYLPKLTQISGDSSSGRAFSYCSSLVRVSLPSLKTISGGRHFEYCESLKYVDLPELTSIGSGTSSHDAFNFNNCGCLETVNLPKLTKLCGDGQFMYCGSLHQLTFPSVTAIGVATQTQYSTIFSECSGLERINFPELKNIYAASAFSHCKNLHQIIAPLLEHISGANVFEGCTDLDVISFPALEDISGSYTFKGCSQLTTIDLPSLESITGSRVFEGCSAIRDFTISSTWSDFSVSSTFASCYGLTNFELPSDWNTTGLDISTGNLSVSSMLDMITALKDRTGDTTYTLTFGARNLAKLTAAQIAVATAKNWTLA